MKMHRRELIVNKAAVEVQDVFMRHNLRFGERVRICADILSSIAKYIIREERHPNDPDMPGGLEDDGS